MATIVQTAMQPSFSTSSDDKFRGAVVEVDSTLLHGILDANRVLRTFNSHLLLPCIRPNVFLEQPSSLMSVTFLTYRM